MILIISRLFLLLFVVGLLLFLVSLSFNLHDFFIDAVITILSNEALDQTIVLGHSWIQFELPLSNFGDGS